MRSYPTTAYVCTVYAVLDLEARVTQDSKSTTIPVIAGEVIKRIDIKRVDNLNTDEISAKNFTMEQ